MSPEPDLEITRDVTLGVGTVVDDRYRIIGVAGKGGMGVVYKAHHVHISRTVALKMLLRDFSADDQEFRRFKQEADAASQLRHPNIVSIYDFGPVGKDQFYLAMDYLDGKSMWDEVREVGPLSLQRFKRVFTQACDALEHAHRHKVVHRDIKSGNLVLVERDGNKDFLVIVDFGLVKLMSQAEDQHLTTAGTLVGSPLYMSPEQCRAQPLDHRTDIYSLGCVMYESLTGELPFLGDTMLDTIYKHLKESPSPLKERNPAHYVPPALERVIFKALSKEPDQRQQTMAELGLDINRALSAAADYVAPVLLSSQVSSPRPVSAIQQSATVTGIQRQTMSTSLPTGTRSYKSRKTAQPGWIMPAMIVFLVGVVVVPTVMMSNRKVSPNAATTYPGNLPSAVPVNVAGGSALNTVSVGRDASGSADLSGQDGIAVNSSAAGGGQDQLLAQAQQLESRGQRNYAASKWFEARSDFEQALSIRQKLVGKTDDPMLLPTVAKLAVCAANIEDTGLANSYMKNFRSLYNQFPDAIANDDHLLSQLSAASQKMDDLPFAEQLMRAAVNSQVQRTSEKDHNAIVLSMNLSKLLSDQGKNSEAEQLLKSAVENSRNEPDLNATSKNWLAHLLRSLGRNDEAAELDGH